MSIEAWHEILEQAEQKKREATDHHVRVFNEAMARIARLELTRLVSEKMRQ